MKRRSTLREVENCALRSGARFWSVEQDELPVEARMVEVERIAQLVPDLGRIARDVDVEVLEPCLLPREVLERPSVALDQHGAFHGTRLPNIRPFSISRLTMSHASTAWAGPRPTGTITGAQTSAERRPRRRK
jgi:hypothetical protein